MAKEQAAIKERAKAIDSKKGKPVEARQFTAKTIPSKCPAFGDLP